MKAISSKFYLLLILMALVVISCDEDENPVINDFGETPTFDWIKSFNFVETDSLNETDVFTFENGDTDDALPVYLFHGVLLNSIEESTLTNKTAEFNDDNHTFSIQRDYSLDDDENYSNRHGSINIVGDFESDSIFRYLSMNFYYTADLESSEENNTLTENFAINISNVPYVTIDEEVHVRLDATFLEEHIREIEYISSVPAVDGNIERVLSNINWARAKTVGLPLEIVFSTRAEN